MTTSNYEALKGLTLEEARKKAYELGIPSILEVNRNGKPMMTIQNMIRGRARVATIDGKIVGYRIE